MSTDHIFISYAWEDAALARWLTLKLTAQGYRVWCDEIKLLGGESYPRDIDNAIKTGTFRMLALLSRHSIHKPNPMKERTLALNVARERQVDFVIPINVDGLKPTELDWMTNDLTYIPFDRNWAEGLRRLLKKLESLDAPRPLARGSQIAIDSLDESEVVARSPELLFTNELRFAQIPEALHRYRVSGGASRGRLTELSRRWPFHPARSGAVVYSLTPPPRDLESEFRRSGGTLWTCNETIDGIPTHNVVIQVLKRSLLCQGMNRGLVVEPEHHCLYFPIGLLPKDTIHFKSYTGKLSTVLAVGKRSIARQNRERVSYRYHLAHFFRVYRDREGHFAQLRLRLHLTDDSGTALPNHLIVSRRKRVTRSWWNHQWLTRYLAVLSYLAAGEDTIAFGEEAGSSVVLAAHPTMVRSPVSVNEGSLGPVKIDDVVAERIRVEDLDDHGFEDDLLVENQP